MLPTLEEPVGGLSERQTCLRTLWYAGACGVFLTLTAITFADNTKCLAPSLNDHPFLKPDGLSPRDAIIGMSIAHCPRLAGFFGWCAVGCIFAAVLFDPYGSFSCKHRLHVWAARYGALVSGITLVHVFMWPWVLVKICPDEFIWWSDFLHVCEYSCFIPAKLVLGHLVVLRIHRLNILPNEAKRARKLLLAGTAMIGPFLPSLVFFTVVFGRPSLYERDAILFIHLAWLLVALMLWTLFQFQALHSLGTMASKAWLELKEHSKNSSAVIEIVEMTYRRAAYFAVAEVCCLFFSVFTTAAFTFSATFFGILSDRTFATEFIFESILAIDALADSGIVILSSGLYGSKAAAFLKQLRNDQDPFCTIGKLAADRRKRRIMDALADAASARTGPEMTLAAMLEGQDPKMLVRRAVSRFRCIDWAVLREHPEIIIGGGPLERTHTSGDIFDFSQPCLLTECDAFFSHSWHDDEHKKWEALKEWCEAFLEKHGRTPRLWLDRVCISQSNIKADLQCLPIFLAGCNQLFVVSGTSYTSRLWCCLELFVYVTMKVSDESRSPPHVTIIGDRKTVRDNITDKWINFDAAECQSFDPEDKRRIMDVIENHPGGLNQFNLHVKKLATQLFAKGLEEPLRQMGLPNAGESLLTQSGGVEEEEKYNFCSDEEKVIVEAPSGITKERWRFSL